MGRISGKVAIVTGASAGIGLATAKLFASEGGKVVVGARRAEELNELVEQIRSNGGEAVALAGDVRSEDYAKALVALAVVIAPPLVAMTVPAMAGGWAVGPGRGLVITG